MEFSDTVLPDVILEETQYSTISPKLLENNATAVSTIIIIAVIAILTISLLFGIALFIDCRQRKLAKMHATKPRTLFNRIRLPGFGRNVDEDEETFADKIQSEEVYASLSSVA